MDSPRKMRGISKGVSFSSVQDPRFKTNRISVNLITSLNKETATINALIPQVLRKGFRGCEDFTELNQRLQALYGAYLDADVQKRGDHQILSFSITVISDRFALHGEPISAQAAEILCDLTLHPLEEEGGFRPQYVELEKTALIDTIEAEINDKHSYSVNSLIREMCGGEPYGIPRYGFRDRVGEITPSAALAQYRELLRTARIELFFVGSGDPEPVCQVFEEAFQSVERDCGASALSRSTPHPLREGEIRRKTERMAVTQSKLVLGFSTGIPADAENVPAVRMMSAVFGGGGIPASKLFLNLRERLSLCYYCSARYDIYKGLVIVSCGVEHQNAKRAEEEILIQLRELQEGNISDREYQSALLSLKNAYATIYENDASVENFYLRQLLTGQDLSPEQERKKLDALTREELVQAARTLRYDTVYLLTGKEEEAHE